MRAAGRRGSGVIEFTLVGIPIIFLTAGIIEMSIEAWRYESMMYAIQIADRYACEHGRTCTKNGASCTIKVENVATIINQQAPSLDTSKLVVTLKTHSATVNCNPLSTCLTNTTQFPSSTDNGVGLPITITASYPMQTPFPMTWFGSSSAAQSSITLAASTLQSIVF